MGVARPQRTEETENGTERLATSAEDVSYLAAFLFSLVQTSRKADERYDGVGVRDLVVMTVTVARASSADQSASEPARTALLLERHRLLPERCHRPATRSTGRLPSGMPCRAGRHVQSPGTENDSRSPWSGRSRRGLEWLCAT